MKTPTTINLNINYPRTSSYEIPGIFPLTPKKKTTSKRQFGPLTDQPENKMRLSIAHNIIIDDLQKTFQENFPHLSIRFVKTQLAGTSSASIKKLCNTSSPLGKEIMLKKEGEINISNDTTVDELIHEFREDYGIPVQLFRKSGNLWIEITLTSNYTLLQQNIMGRELSI